MAVVVVVVVVVMVLVVVVVGGVVLAVILAVDVAFIVTDPSYLPQSIITWAFVQSRANTPGLVSWHSSVGSP